MFETGPPAASKQENPIVENFEKTMKTGPKKDESSGGHGLTGKFKDLST